ncbi:hypothetical protein M1N05_03000 [Dehalococcoidales bacterium]|nr:hypothetical protein [Dehalococcoidales bacterium]
MRTVSGISDFTSSEWKLRRFSEFCRLIYDNAAVGDKEIISLIKSKKELTNRAVIARHIRIMNKLGLLKGKEEDYLVSSEAKALLQLMGDEWNTYEKGFYLKALFTNAFYQMNGLLQVINDNQGKDKIYIIIEYFRKSCNWPSNPWALSTVQEGLKRYEQQGNLPRWFESKFECMQRWLEQLELISRLSLTNYGKALIVHLNLDTPPQSQQIFSLASIYIGKTPESVSCYSDREHRLLFMNLFNEAVKLFGRKELRIIDLRAIRVYICIKFLVDNQIALETSGFDRVINTLVDEGTIKSLIKDEQGQLAYISVG